VRLLHNRATAWIVLGVSLVLTAAAWFISERFVQQRAQDRFIFQANDLKAAIVERMVDYEAVLRGGLGLFEASDEVTREEWKTYVTSLQIQRFYPGIQGIGFARMIAPGDKADFEAGIRRQGFPDFAIKPSGDRQQYSAIEFLEPFDWRNRRAFGYDMFSDSVRREAMARARDTGRSAISGKVTLVQETDTDVQAGFLLYLPLYQRGTKPATVQERRERLIGFVYSPFRFKVLMRGIMGEAMSDFSFEVYDGRDADREALLFASETPNHEAGVLHGLAGSERSKFFTRLPIEIAGQPWTLFVSAEKSFVPSSDQAQPTMVAAAGIIIDILLFIIINTLVRRRNWAEARALEMTEDLRKFSMAIDQSSANVIITDTDGIIEYVNPRFTQTTGYSREETIGRKANLLSSGETPSRTYEDLWTTLRQGREWCGQFRNRRKDGSLYWEEALIAPVADEEGRVTNFLSVQQDITERKELEALKATTAERFHSAFENVATGAIVINEAGEIELFNDAAQQIFGYAAEEVIGKNVKILMPESYGSEHDGYIRRYKDTKKKKIIGVGRDVTGRRKSGEVFPMHLGVGELKVGRKRSFIGSVTDLSELVATRDSLQSALIAAESANTAKSEFLAAMSHEIRTPMTGVMGFADLLLDKDLDSDSRDKVYQIKDSTRDLLRIINDILDMSKLEAGKMALENSDFHLRPLVDDVVEMFAEKREDEPATQVAVKTVFADGLPDAINLDQTRLRQVLINLLGNAKKFTEAGEIVVSVELTDCGSDGRQLRFSIRDTGIGIHADAINLLFSEFTQADASISRKYQGTGLGLSICKNLVSLMGGEIGVESTLGEGSTFWFTVPCIAATAEVATKKEAMRREIVYVAKRPLHILAVDDNALNRQIITSILKGYGHTFDVAENGMQGVEAVKASAAGQYDLILMDIRMPIMSGTEATEIIRGLYDDRKDIPIVALTADAMEDHQQAYFAAGMNGIVTKPIDRVGLALTINHVMGKVIHEPRPVSPEPPIPDGVPEDPEADAEKLAAVTDFLSQIEGASLDSND